ncbi:hypothetical protein HZS_1550 [Henneguya salminicola]|nr:hypothetical protein HZS_1550 [Henneguya salminicola]
MSNSNFFLSWRGCVQPNWSRSSGLYDHLSDPRRFPVDTIDKISSNFGLSPTKPHIQPLPSRYTVPCGGIGPREI